MKTPQQVPVKSPRCSVCAYRLDEVGFCALCGKTQKGTKR